MNKHQILEETREYVKRELAEAEGGHDWFHVERVFNNTVKIAQTESVDTLVVCLAALLHDIADPKFYGGDETIGPKKAEEFMQKLDIPKSTREHVVYIIRHMSFKNSLEAHQNEETLELQVVRDADRLDAIGAIGIARAFNFGGYKNRSLYNPDIPPRLDLTKEEYKKSDSPTINHFYEKLLLLKGLMHTITGRHLAERRHQFMLDFLDSFYREWDETATTNDN